MMSTWPRLDVHSAQLVGGQLQVYRRDDKLVSGPCMSLYVGEVEVLRIDLPVKPEGKCHEHWFGLDRQPRMFYPRDWDRPQLVELALSNLVEHAPIAAALVGLQPPPREQLIDAARWARPLLEVA